MPWGGPLLLSWAGLLGWREMMATKQCCKKTQLCPEATPLLSPAGLRALPAGTEGKGAKLRQVTGKREWEVFELRPH